MSWWGRRGKGSAAVAFSMMEDLFAPSRSAARLERERQALVGDEAPAPTDPPAQLDDDGFGGRITLRRPPRSGA